MNRLAVSAGSGRLSRSGRIILFTLEPDDELHGLRPTPGGEVFKALATLIVERNFAVPSLAAIDLEASGLFLFGDIEIQVDGELVSGADSATWTERRFAPGATVTSGGMTDAAADTCLVEGCVPAAAFGLNLFQPSDSRPAETRDAAPVEAGNAASVPSNVFDDPGIDLDQIGAATPIAGAAAVVASAAVPDEPESFDGDETEEPDRPAQPVPAAHTAATPTPTAPSPDDFDPQPSEALSSGRFRAPPVPTLRSNGGLASDQPATPPPSEPRLARLACGNGRTVVVGAGLLVGRFPDKHGVPDGYETLKVTGPEVSRVHLLFLIENDCLYVQDQNTSNGSTLISSQRSIRPVPSGSGRAPLEPGDSVEFGDQTITFQGWESGASA